MPFFTLNHSVVTALELVVGSNLQLEIEAAGKDGQNWRHFVVRASGTSVEVECNAKPSAKTQTITLKPQRASATEIRLQAFDTATTHASSAKVPAVSVRVVEQLILPAENTDAGLVARLLIAETALGPRGGPAYSRADLYQGMDLMKQVLDNRLTVGRHQPLIGRGINNGITVNNYRDVIGTPGQFHGFDGGAIAPAVASRINNWVAIANRSRSVLTVQSSQPNERDVVKNALSLANAATVVNTAIDTTTPVAWRTTGRGVPGGGFAQLSTVAGNTFYSLTQQFINDNRRTPRP